MDKDTANEIYIIPGQIILLLESFKYWKALLDLPVELEVKFLLSGLCSPAIWKHPGQLPEDPSTGIINKVLFCRER